MNKVIAVLIALLLLAAPVLADTKIAYVDLQKALNLSQAGIKAKNEIASQVKKYEAEFKTKQENLKKMKAELQKQAVLLSDSAKAQKERDFQQNVKELKRFQKDVKEDLQQKDADHTKQILNQMFAVLQKLGKDGDYQMILEKNQGAVVYADKKIDLTDKLIKAFDATQK